MDKWWVKLCLRIFFLMFICHQFSNTETLTFEERNSLIYSSVAMGSELLTNRI